MVFSFCAKKTGDIQDDKLQQQVWSLNVNVQKDIAADLTITRNSATAQKENFINTQLNNDSSSFQNS